MKFKCNMPLHGISGHFFASLWQYLHFREDHRIGAFTALCCKRPPLFTSARKIQLLNLSIVGINRTDFVHFFIKHHIQ